MSKHRFDKWSRRKASTSYRSTETDRHWDPSNASSSPRQNSNLVDSASSQCTSLESLLLGSASIQTENYSLTERFSDQPCRTLLFRRHPQTDTFLPLQLDRQDNQSLTCSLHNCTPSYSCYVSSHFKSFISSDACIYPTLSTNIQGIISKYDPQTLSGAHSERTYVSHAVSQHCSLDWAQYMYKRFT